MFYTPSGWIIKRLDQEMAFFGSVGGNSEFSEAKKAADSFGVLAHRSSSRPSTPSPRDGGPTAQVRVRLDTCSARKACQVLGSLNSG